MEGHLGRLGCAILSQDVLCEHKELFPQPFFAQRVSRMTRRVDNFFLEDSAISELDPNPGPYGFRGKSPDFGIPPERYLPQQFEQARLLQNFLREVLQAQITVQEGASDAARDAMIRILARGDIFFRKALWVFIRRSAPRDGHVFYLFRQNP